jgi:hypothetical protein
MARPEALARAEARVFLLNQSSANTSIARDAYNTDLTKWVTWTTPTLQ